MVPPPPPLTQFLQIPLSNIKTRNRRPPVNIRRPVPHLYETKTKKVQGITCHESTEREYSYSSTLRLILALGGVGSQHHVPALLPPGKIRYPWYSGWVSLEAGQDGMEYLVHTGIRSPVQPAASDIRWLKCACVRSCERAYLHTYTYITYVHTYVHTYIHIHCIRTYIHTYTYEHTYTHTHTHTHTMYVGTRIW